MNQSIVTWGSNGEGQLGIAERSISSPPKSVVVDYSLSGKTVSQIDGGGFHSLALCSDGTILSWGDNAYSQLGDDAKTDRDTPREITSAMLAGKTVTQVASGTLHNLALCSDGTLFAWGYNAYGQLGNATTNSSDALVTVVGDAFAGKKVKQIAGGFYHSLALCDDGTVFAWGSNGFGQLGNGTSTSSSVPVAVTGGALSGKTVTHIAAGDEHNLALCSDGTLIAWGYNSQGQLGVGSTTSSRIPVTVNNTALSGKTITQVDAGYSHSLALCSDSTIFAWGDNASGQLGVGNNSNSTVPIPVVASGALSGKTVIQVAAGYSHSLALCSDSTIFAWGDNASGQLGTGNANNSTVPVTIDEGDFFEKATTRIAAGGFHNLAIAPLLPTHEISGKVTFANGSPVPDVLIIEAGSPREYASITDDDGNYSAHVVNNTVTLVSNKPGFSFTPATRTVTSDTDITNINFTANITSASSGAIISEFRCDGPYGEGDEFVEIYNTNLNSSIDLSGWSLAYEGGTTFINTFPHRTFPSGTIIPPKGHLLCANWGYSLTDYSSVDFPFSLGIDLPPGAQIQLLNARGEIVDKTMLQSGATSTTDQYSYVRDLSGGLPKDTDSDSDFVLVSTATNSGTGVLRVGAPGPEGLVSPIQHNTTLLFELADKSVAATAVPNQTLVRGGTLNGTPLVGTVFLRRTITNNTGDAITALRFRAVKGTMGTGHTADVRLINAAPSASSITVSGKNVTLLPTILDSIPNQTSGALNSTVSVALPNGSLANGQSVTVEFALAFIKTGTYQVLFNLEATH